MPRPPRPSLRFPSAWTRRRLLLGLEDRTTPAGGFVTGQTYLDLNQNALDAGEVSSATGPDGLYRLTTDAAGDYRARLGALTSANPGTITLTGNNAVAAGDFGLRPADDGLSVEPGTGSTTRVFYANDGATTNDVYATAVGDDANSGLTPAAPKRSVQAVLDAYDVCPADRVVVDTGGYASVGISAADEGAAYAGSPFGSQFTHDGTRFDLTDADHNLFYGLILAGPGGTGFYLHKGAADPSTDNVIRDNRFPGTDTAVHIDGGADNKVLGNVVTGGGSYGVYLYGGASAAEVRGNQIAGRTYATTASASPCTTGTTSGSTGDWQVEADHDAHSIG